MYLGLALPSLAQEGAARVSLRCERHGPIGAVSPDRAVFSIIRPPPLMRRPARRRGRARGPCRRRRGWCGSRRRPPAGGGRWAPASWR